MSNQIIITISRESGSAGHTIAKILSDKLGIKLLDKELVEETVQYTGYSREHIRRYDEKPINFFASRKIGRYSNSLEANVAQKVFEYVKKKADEGESFVLVGRCGHFLLKDNPNAVHIFVRGDYDAKVNHLMEYHDLSREEAVAFMKQTDKDRKTYHNYYCDVKWGDSRGYDLCINSSKLGIERSANVVCEFVNLLMRTKE